MREGPARYSRRALPSEKAVLFEQKHIKKLWLMGISAIGGAHE